MRFWWWAVGAAVVSLLAVQGWRSESRLLRWWSSVWWAVLSSGLMAFVLTALLTQVQSRYGFVLFLAVPVLCGFTATAALNGPVRVRDAMKVSIVAVLVTGVFLLLGYIEGLICLAMALPLALPLACLGGYLGYLARRTTTTSPVALLLIIAGVPMMGGIEKRILPPPGVDIVTTTLDLPQAPEQVWQTILEPTHLPPPTDLILKTGIAYPLASHIEGTGQTATRYCDFTTGKLVEPVVIWDAPHRLRFRVVKSPPPMRELSPYPNLSPPHLDGSLVTVQGEFRLEPLLTGGTRLYATTWYRDDLRPRSYWRLWSDAIIHREHAMVLADVQRRSSGIR